ncbi:ArsA family ATPase [Isoptericola sp. NEAU-Y5]|uniref:ArsA family ATPase n=1 Tax=Isoptericola luteus TaxID=2879484 RepID=A0ABS7ZEW8_9MICO|nr:ArsA family ATPase [Isoptericola sp. NEAU-Y5]MCA5892149.1 ArsA family ATPase [Isoptericola sp. NEAU-Y5]
MLLDLAARRRVLFLGGKGGVGKTSIASATALAQARAGRRVLVVSTDPAHNLGHLWQRTVGDDVVRLAGPFGTGVLDGVEIDPGRTTDAHLAAVRRTLHRLVPPHLSREVDRHLDLARDAPGTHEAAVLERVATAVEAGLRDHDLVVFDTAPSGHTARLLTLPETMGAWTDGLLRRRERSERLGAAARMLGGQGETEARRDSEIRHVLTERRTRFARLRDVLTDPTITAFVVVLAAERLPVLETIELCAQLDGLGVPVGGLVVNKRSPADAGGLLAARHTQEAAHLRTLTDTLGHLPRDEVPLLGDDLVGEDALQHLVRYL